MDEWLPIPTQNTDWITLVLGANFLLFVFIKRRFQIQFFSFLRLIDTAIYFNNYANNPTILSGFVNLSSLFSLTTLSVFAVFFLHSFYGYDLDFSLFITLFLCTLLMLIIRAITVYVLSYVIEVRSFVHQYQFRSITYIFRLCTLLFIAMVFYHYWLDHSSAFFKVMLYVGFMIYLGTQLMIIRQLIHTIKDGSLYFILYLCTLKSSPWIILFMGIKRIFA